MSDYNWKKKNMVGFTFSLFKTTDGDIIEVLTKQRSRREFIKNALRYYIANGCPVPEAKEEEGEAE